MFCTTFLETKSCYLLVFIMVSSWSVFFYIYTGVDTIGGVRIPGAYCGILAFRPSYAAVSTLGFVPVSPSLDTIGM